VRIIRENDDPNNARARRLWRVRRPVVFRHRAR
jgi:hypothetical protein